MDLAPDPVFVQVRRALRSALAAVPVLPEVHGAPVVDGARGPARGVLEQLEVADFERPATADGLNLGVTAGALVSEELGRAACGNPYRAGAMAADVGLPGPWPAGVALAGLEASPGRGGVTVSARGAGWELTGAATVDDPEAALVLVVVASGVGRWVSGVEGFKQDRDHSNSQGHGDHQRGSGAPVLIAVPRDAPGVSVQTDCWPSVVHFEGTPIASADIVAESADTLAGPLARARVRQAAYLLGIAEGAHRIAVEYTGVRQQFGSRLRDLPAVSFPIARALVTLRATRAAVYRAAWLLDAVAELGAGIGAGAGAGIVEAELGTAGIEPLAALAMAAETARHVVRLSMQSCGVRAMTAELGLHRYFRLAAAESTRYGEPAALWRAVGAARVGTVRDAAKELAAGAMAGF